jgi:type VI protein secretion system component VasK
MARRRNDRLLDVFVALPWWASVIAGSFAFIAMYWIVPSSLANSRIFFGLAPVTRSLAWLVLLVFAITTLVAYARSRLMAGSRKSRGDGRDGLRPMREPKLDMLGIPPIVTVDSGLS